MDKAGYSKEYLATLAAGLAWLDGFLVRCGLRLGKEDEVSKVDDVLSEVVQRAWEAKARLYLVVHAVLGIQKRFRISGSLLRCTWRRIEGWRMLKGGRSRIPLTRYLLQGLVVVAFGFAATCLEMAERERWWSAGLAWWLGFDALMRPGEVLALRVADLVFPQGGGECDPGVVVVIRAPKTRRVWRAQFVLVEDVTLVARRFLRSQCSGGPRP